MGWQKVTIAELLESLTDGLDTIKGSDSGEHLPQTRIQQRTRDDHPKKFPVLAEAIYVSFNHSERTITAETPSEYDLSKRIEAQIAMIQRAIELSFV